MYPGYFLEISSPGNWLGWICMTPCSAERALVWKMHSAVTGSAEGALSGSGKTGVGTVSGVEEANRGSGAGLEKPGFST